MIERGINLEVTGSSTITNLLGTQANGNPCVFWSMQLRGTAVPSLVMQVALTSDVYSATGATGLRFKRIQFDAYGADYYAARAVADVVRTHFQDFQQGSLPDGTYVEGCKVVRDLDFPFEIGGTTKGYIYRSLIEIEFAYQEAALPVYSPTLPEPDIDGGPFV